MMFSSRFTWTSEVNRLTRILTQKKTKGEPILDLTVSNPTQAGFFMPESDICRAISLPEMLVYEPNPKGLYAARKAVQSYYHFHQRQIEPDDLVITSSTSEGYSFLFKLLCDAGDAILVPQPGYPLLDFLASLEYVTIDSYSSGYTENRGWTIDIQSIRESIRESTAAIVIVNPNNPTGSYLKQSELEEIGAVCVENDIALIVDEVFLDYPSGRQSNIAGSVVHRSAPLTFVLSGLSKICCLPQVKMGWIHVSGPNYLAAAALERLEWIADTYLSVSGMVQHAAPILLDKRHIIQDQIQTRIRANEEYLIQTLTSIPSVQPFIREGGWYAVVDIKNGFTDEQTACEWLEEDNILAHPGYFYGFDHDNIMVFSLMTPPDKFQEGFRRIADRIR